MRIAIVVAAFLVLTGCSTMKPETTPVSEVLNHLKTELELFKDTKANTQAQGDLCKGPDGYPVVNIIPTTATLTLKTTTTTSSSANLGVAIPVTSVVTVTPGLASSYSSVHTQQLTLDLKVDHEKTVSEERSEIELLKKQIDDDGKAADAIQKTDPKLAAEIRKGIQKKSAAMLKAYTDLVKKEVAGSPSLGTKPYSKEAFQDHPLADTLWNLREELLRINHNQAPCLKPGQLKSQIDFQVVKKVDGNVKITFYIVSVGGGVATTDDRTQSMVVSFDMGGSSSQLLVK